MTTTAPDTPQRILRDEVADSLDAIGDTATASAIQAVVLREDETLLDVALGATRLDGASTPVRPTTRFDTASLTKVLVTVPLACQAVDAGACRWDGPVGDYLDWWPDSGPKSDVRVRHLLTHTSGLPDWRPTYEGLPFEPGPDDIAEARHAYRRELQSVELDAEPGRRETYSDLGYIALAFLLESLFGDDLHRLARRRIFTPLDLDRTTLRASFDDDPPVDGAPATENQPGRAEPVQGRVHDRNAAALGGVAGHAGVFSTARDVADVCRHHLLVDRGDLESDVVPADALAFCWSPESGGVGHHRGGWDTPSGDETSAGRGFGAGRTVGHLGFTGTSIWIERHSETVAVLLTNRVYPSRDNDRIHDLRVAFHEAVLSPDAYR